jgi:hypothetical protein
MFLIQARDRDHQRTFGALAWDDDFAVFATFQDRVEAVETQAALVPLFAMAANAGRLEDGLNVFCISDPLLF